MTIVTRRAGRAAAAKRPPLMAERCVQTEFISASHLELMRGPPQDIAPQSLIRAMRRVNYEDTRLFTYRLYSKCPLASKGIFTRGL